MSEENKQKILIEVVYNGLGYHGLAYQGSTTNTISKKITDALINTKLIPTREFAEIQFIGRTDKGVSAVKNCCSVFVRKCIYKNKEQTINTRLPYCKIINSKLPKSIRAVKYAIVDDDFSCLERCNKRGYKYYIVHDNRQPNSERMVCDKCITDFNIENIHKALDTIKGEHDFRNLCKVNFDNCKTYNRIIYKAEIKKIMKFDDGLGKFSVYELYLEANGFLWHLVRNIASILMRIGNNIEEPEVFDFLLNVDVCKIKPNYSIGLSSPLILCHYEFKNNNEIDWVYNNNGYILYQNNQIRDVMKESFYNFITWSNIEKVFAKMIEKSCKYSSQNEIEIKEYTNKKCCKNNKRIKDCIDVKGITFEEKYKKYKSSKKK